MNNDENNNDLPVVLSEQTIVLRKAFQYCTEQYNNFQLKLSCTTKAAATTLSFNNQQNCSNENDVKEEQQRQQQQQKNTVTDAVAVAFNDTNNNDKVSKSYCTFTRAMNIVQQQQQQQRKEEQLNSYHCNSKNTNETSSPIIFDSIDKINTISCNEFRYIYQINNKPCIIRNVQDTVLTNDTLFSQWILANSSTTGIHPSNTSTTSTSSTTDVMKVNNIQIDNNNNIANECSNGNRNSSLLQKQKLNYLRQWFSNTLGNETIVPVRRKEKQKQKQKQNTSMTTTTTNFVPENNQQQCSNQLDIDGRATITEKVIPMKLYDWIQILDDSNNENENNNNDNYSTNNEFNQRNDCTKINKNSSIVITVDSTTSKATEQCNNSSIPENSTCYEYYLKDWHLQSWIRNNIQNSNNNNNNNNVSTKVHSKELSSTTSTIPDTAHIMNYNSKHTLANAIPECSLTEVIADLQEQPEQQQQRQLQPLLYNVLEHFQYDLLNNFLLQFSVSSLNQYSNDSITVSTTSTNDYMFVYWGPKGSSTDRHSDVMNSFSWSYNVIGSKLWTFYFPNYHNDDDDKSIQKSKNNNVVVDVDCVDDNANNTNNKGNNLNNDDYTSTTTIQIIQNANEIIFVPCQLQHSVLNLEETISINHNWITTANIHAVWDCIYTEIQAIDIELQLWNNNLENDYEIKENMLHGCVGINISSFIFMILVRLLDLLATTTPILDESKPGNNANTIIIDETDHDDNDFGNYENDCNSQVLYWYDIIQLVSILTKLSSTSYYNVEQQQQQPNDSANIHLHKRLTAMLQCEQSASRTIEIINTILTIHEQYIAAMS